MNKKNVVGPYDEILYCNKKECGINPCSVWIKPENIMLSESSQSHTPKKDLPHNSTYTECPEQAIL